MSEKAGYKSGSMDMGFMQPKKKSIFTNIYDPETKAILRRTCKSWLLIILFYAIFYSLLTCFFLGMISVLMRGLIDDTIPMQTGDNSLLRLKPGLGFRPQPDHKSTLIQYSPEETSSSLLYISSLHAFLYPYLHANGNDKVAKSYATCKDGQKTPDSIFKPCNFDLKSLGQCSPSNNYGYDTLQPCVLIKLNRIYGWLPDVNSTESTIRVECTGIYPADKENIRELKYFPSTDVDGRSYGTFDTAFFPYLNQRGYLQPIVAVQFTDVEKDMVLHVSCKIVNAPNTNLNPVKFEISVQTTPDLENDITTNITNPPAVVNLVP